jgi:hypothetical protein
VNCDRQEKGHSAQSGAADRLRPAWVYAVLAEHQWIIAQYPEHAQIDVWGDDPEAVASCSLAPREAARRVPGLAVELALPVLQRLRLCAMGDHRHLPR